MMKRSSRFGTLRHPDWARNTMLAADSMKSWERYPMHAEATKHVQLGRKNLGRPAAISCSSRDDLGGEQT
jgi:hypothetical protein